MVCERDCAHGLSRFCGHHDRMMLHLEMRWVKKLEKEKWESEKGAGGRSTEMRSMTLTDVVGFIFELIFSAGPRIFHHE